jgi:acetolactate synthase I/II/III large subunit
VTHQVSSEPSAADELIDSLAECGIDTIFANPGTTEMPLVAALDNARRPVRAILGLQENVCSAAADGYYRTSGKPAATLLHLGPGLTNSGANLHNAKRAGSGLVNLIGDHPAAHLGADSQLQTKLETLANAMSDWTGIAGDPDGQPRMAQLAAGHAWQGRIASLIIPHDVQSVRTTRRSDNIVWAAPSRPQSSSIDVVARHLKAAQRPALLAGGSGLTARALTSADALSKACGAPLYCETLFASMDRGGGLPQPIRLPYFPEDASAALAQHDLVVLIGTREPVAFFKYAGMPSVIVPPGAKIVSLAEPHQNVELALAALLESAYRLNEPVIANGQGLVPELNDAALDAMSLCRIVAASIPQDGIVIDEGITSSLGFYALSGSSNRFRHLCLTGGAIGWGPGGALGAAIGAPGCSVINIQADGSGLYLPQALWSQARHDLPIVTIICSNRRYRILDVELIRAGNATPGPNARAMCDLDGIDWLAISSGFGVKSTRVDTTTALATALARALASGGPHLIEAGI